MVFTLFKTNLGTGATYTLTPSADGKTLNYSLTGTGTANNSVVLAVRNASGFGANMTVKYTLKQSVPINGYGGTYFMDDDYVTILTGHDRSVSSATTYSSTFSVNNSNVLYLLIDIVHGYTINGTISDVYINDELVTFK
jgi:hypothetical protein